RYDLLPTASFFGIRIEFHLATPMSKKPTLGVMGFVHGDPVNPGLQGALPPKSSHVAEHLEEDLLHHVASFRLIVQQAQREGVYGLLKASDEVFVGLFGTFAEKFHETEIIGFSARLRCPLRTQP